MDPSLAEHVKKEGESPVLSGVPSMGDANSSKNKNNGGGRPLVKSRAERDDDTLLQRYYQAQRRLLDGGTGTATTDGGMATDGKIVPEADPLPILNKGDVTEIVDQVAGHLTAGFQSSNASYILQGDGGGGDNHVSIDMPPQQQVPATLSPPAPAQLVNAIWTTSLLTTVSAISTTLYKPARGVVFGHNKRAYYSVLSAILASGLGEASTAFWLSRPGGASRRRLTIGRAVLCASVLPLVAVLGIASYGFMDG